MSITEAKNYPASRPTKITLFLRSCLLWQVFRFIIINLKMTVMILKSHGSKKEKKL